MPKRVLPTARCVLTEMPLPSQAAKHRPSYPLLTYLYRGFRCEPEGRLAVCLLRRVRLPAVLPGVSHQRSYSRRALP